MHLYVVDTGFGFIRTCQTLTGEHCFEKLVPFPCSINLKYLFEAHAVKCVNIQWFSDMDSRLINIICVQTYFVYIFMSYHSYKYFH